MSPASSRAIVKWTSVLAVVLALFSFANLAFAQTRGVSRPKLHNHQLVLSHPPMAATASMRVAAKNKAAPPNTSDSWTGLGDGTSWNNASNWSAGVPNSSTVDVTIGTTTAAVNDNINASVGNLTLSHAGDSLTVGNNLTLSVFGNSINNAGTITLGSTGNGTFLAIDAATVKLSGGGNVVLGTSGPNFINGSAVTNTLVNQNNTISGVGTVGNGQILLSNAGTFKANVSGHTLTLNPSGASINAGSLTATGGGNLLLSGASWNNTGGTINAQTGSTVTLSGTTITSGTLTTAGTGALVSSNSALSGLTNAGNLQNANNTTTTISGTITNHGTITLASTGNGTILSVGSGSATLAGTGTLVLGTGATNFINGSGGTFTNNSTITGVGTIGNGQISLVNNATINANISPTVSGAPLVLSPNGGGMTNTATLEATNGGTLELSAGNYTNSGSGTVIEALGDYGLGAAATVILGDSAVIDGGTLTTTGAGVILGENNTLQNLTNTGNFRVVNNNATTLVGTITNTGTITLASTGNNTFLNVGGSSVTLQGSGTLVMGSSGPNFINGTSGASFVNKETITSAGT